MAIITPRKAPSRVHIVRPSLWTRSAATDYWANFGPTWLGIAADELLTDNGWTSTSMTLTAGTLGDLLSSADPGSSIAITDATTDEIISPSLFGDYGHGQMAASILGYNPTKLNLEAYAAFTVSTAAETVSGFGFSTGSGLTATNHIAYIYSDATNFAMRGTPGTGAYTDVGAVRDANYHLWKITATAGGTVEWFIDGTSQGTITLVTDLFPTAFCVSSTTTNRVAVDWARIFYS